jgi:hypothetical protein
VTVELDDDELNLALSAVALAMAALQSDPVARDQLLALQRKLMNARDEC